MQSRHRRIYLTPFFLVAVGLGLSGWYGLAWYELPKYTQADIEVSIEANLAVDLARMGPQLQPDTAGMARLRAQIRDELQAEMDREQEEIQQGFAIGLICMVLAVGYLIFIRSPGI